MTPLAGIMGPFMRSRLRRSLVITSGPLPGAIRVLDASTGVWKDGTKTVPSGIGDPVAIWEDQSGNGNDAVQPPTGTMPVVAVGPGGKPAIQWDGSSASLALTTPVVASGAFTVYAIGSRAASSNWTVLGSASAYAGLLVFGDNQSYSIDDAIGIASAPYTGSTGALACSWTRPDLATPVTFTATGQAPVALSAANGVSSTFGYLGARPGIGNYGVGVLSHLRFYPGFHDAGEHAQMAAWIESEWGASIP